MRKFTNKVLEMVDEGMVDRDTLIRDLLMWMSESDVEEFYERNLSTDDEELDEDYEYDGQPDEAQEWHDFDPDC